MNSPSTANVQLPDTMSEILRVDGEETSAQCLEKRVYYKIISGKHKSYLTGSQS